MANRLDAGKPRFDLLHPVATRDLARVFTFGAAKYGDTNWQRGMNWTKMIASAKRHLNAIESGIDYDEESGMLHAAHLAANIHMLNAYYYIYPMGDNRIRPTLSKYRIGLDIDEVLCIWEDAWKEHMKSLGKSTWNAWEEFEIMRANGTLNSFYMGLKPLITYAELHFEPVCYITSRPVASEVSIEWLKLNKFPKAPVYTTDPPDSADPPNSADPNRIIKNKVYYAKEEKLDLFIDDYIENFNELNAAGICTYLFDRPFNRKYNVGHLRLTREKMAELFN